MSGSVAIEVFPEKKKSNLGNIFMKRTIQFSLIGVVCLLGYLSSSIYQKVEVEQVSLPVSLKETVLVENPQRILHEEVTEIVSKVVPEVPQGPLPDSQSWNHAKDLISQKLISFESNGVLVDERSLVIYHVGEANIKDSMEVAENNMKIFTSAITQHTSKATYKAIYLFNVIGHNNHLAQFIPTDNENVAVLKWDSSSSDMLTHTRTVELLGAGITEQFNSIVFLNQGSRGPLNKRADGEWLRDFSRLLSVENVGLAGASISCEVAPHVQTHTFAVKPAMIPTMSALLADAKQGNWVETVKHFEVDLSVWARSAGFEIGSNLYSRRGNQDSFSKCLTPAEGSPKTVTANPTSWCDLKASEVTFQKWGGEPLRTNGFICEAAKDNMYNTLVELQKAEPSLALTIPETLMGGHRFDMYQQYQQEVRVSGDVTIEDKTSDKVCFLVRAYDSSEKAAQSPFIHYGLPSLISSLQKQNDPNWLAVFVNTDNRDYFSTLSATVGSYSDARLKTIDIPKEFRPAFTTADAGYTATDYALREMETWSQCKYITVTNSDNVYGSEVVQRVLSAVVHDHHDHHSKVAPDMLLAPLDSRNFAYQDLSNRGLETIFSSRCTEIMAMLDFMHLAATAQPIPKLGKVDLASMFFNRVKLVQENLNFNDVKSPICPGCQDGLFAEFLIQNRAWNYQRMPIDGLQSIVFHGPSPTLCIASGNVWFDYPLVNGVGCYNHSMVVTLYHDAEVNAAYDWGNYDRNDRMCLRLNEDAFLNVANGQPVTQDASLRKLSQLHLFESSILPTETPTEVPSEVPSVTPSQAPSAAPSVTPSQAPSATPSEAPSAAPSVAPSVEPTFRLTRIPTEMPSAKPSREPTEVPSVVPSREPTEAPSAVPSDAPALYFDVTYGLAGLTTNTLDTAGQNAVCATTEKEMGVSAGACTFIGQSLATRRMLSWSKKETFTINVVLAMKVYTAEFPNLTTKDELRDFLAAKITDAANDGSFIAALEADYSLTVASVSSTVGQYVSTVSPTAAPSTPVPSLAPTTQVPSEAPSAAPTMPPPVVIEIPTQVTVGSPKAVLDDKDQDALCKAAENIAGTPPGSAEFTSQNLKTRRKLVGMKMLETYQIETVVTITASTESFPEMANSPNATTLFQQVTTTMAEAVTYGEFVAQLQEVSVALNATGTATVSELAVVATTFTVVTLPPTMVPSVAPSVQPSAVPSATPSATPSAAPSVEPSATPSATPSVVPSATPSVEPSATPSATPSVEPSATPSATPSVVPSATPSVEPSAVPSATPSVEPSATPSATPSVVPSAEPSLTPSSSPTVRPTRSFVPTNVNSVPPVMIVVSSEFSLSGLNADTLDPLAQQAVCTSTEEILTLPTGSVSFTGQELIPEARRLSGVKLAAFKVKAFVTIRASSDDFAETFSNPNATVLFNKVRTTLAGAVGDNSFATKLRDVSDNLDADVTKDVTDVTVTTNNDYVVSDSLVGEKDGDDLTAGYFAGVVIGVIIFFMIAFAVFWYFFVHEKKQPVEEPDFTAITSIPPREREIADPDQLFLTNGAEQPIVISNGDDLITLTEIEARM